jgi:hypothetical protein
MCQVLDWHPPDAARADGRPCTRRSGLGNADPHARQLLAVLDHPPHAAMLALPPALPANRGPAVLH